MVNGFKLILAIQIGTIKIGELVLFPAIRSEQEATLISASGTSCRHQIADGTGRKAEHPVEILYNALK
jgi:Fe-S oxidoreductase